MSENLWNLVEDKISSHKYMHGVSRKSSRIKATGEIFTPSLLVIEILKQTPVSSFAPGKKVLDPACGDGQFLVGAMWVKILFFELTAKKALDDIYGIDIMRDNVDLCLSRLGGGTIVMGDALNPLRILKGQSKSEREILRNLFSTDLQETLF
jgi:type I restriction-modification system DNA methylase subunit